MGSRSIIGSSVRLWVLTRPGIRGRPRGKIHRRGPHPLERGLVCLFLILSWLWPSEPAAARPLPPTPVTPPRKRSTAPQPFPGLTRKPHCDACAQTIKDRRLPLPSAPPPKIISTRGRRRHVDTSRHFCPDADCRYGRWVGLGNLQANGHPSGGPWRQLHCTACKGYF